MGSTTSWAFKTKTVRWCVQILSSCVVEPTHLKNMLVKIISLSMVENKKYLKPPPSFIWDPNLLIWFWTHGKGGSFFGTWIWWMLMNGFVLWKISSDYQQILYFDRFDLGCFFIFDVESDIANFRFCRMNGWVPNASWESLCMNLLNILWYFVVHRNLSIPCS